MRLTGGQMKGRKVSRRGVGKETKHGVLRPTSSKVRESIFNIIGPRIDGAVFLDLYAGLGTVGMEAMSRGAETVYFVEADHHRATTLRETLEDCGCQPRAKIVHATVQDFIKKFSDDERSWDIVFMDPPYESEEYETIIPLIAGSGRLTDDSLVIAEHATRAELPDTIGGLTVRKRYKYGDTMLSVYIKGKQ